MFGVSLPNTEHQLVFLQHQYQQLHQENMFYQTCIKNQQQLEELKAKKKSTHSSGRKKESAHSTGNKKQQCLCIRITKNTTTFKTIF
jgi:hypothetical protein